MSVGKDYEVLAGAGQPSLAPEKYILQRQGLDHDASNIVITITSPKYGILSWRIEK